MGSYLYELKLWVEVINNTLQKIARLDLSSISRAILEIQKDILENANTCGGRFPHQVTRSTIMAAINGQLKNAERKIEKTI